jgi:hypothetical protein
LETGEDCTVRRFITCTLYYTNFVNKWRRRWAGRAASMEKMKNAYKILVRKPESKRPLGRIRRRWEDNIRMDLRVI